ncbi:beta-lactamase [Fibrella aestuarina BUZ 2]|uniref:Beta-lactamase n=1 Tax=Fibrella aestuarina BUZ 2 TaxID=1166018 RepID=I0KFS1_9BACT|nr:serine hydrolase domain-containing protein [Fibrella aestuarina]CCH02974.1 beta-lactamase [Fibrella aestuarina BUZ 2]
MIVLFRRWVTFAWVSLLITVGVSCGQSTQNQLNRSAAEVRNCAEDQVVSPKEEADLRRAIRADEKRQRIEAIMQQKVREGLNGNVLIAQKGIVLYKHCFGFSHFEKNARDSLVAQSKFQLASLSKTFTAVAVLKLQELGKINFTDSIQQFYPDFPYHGITVRDLLSHRSGLPNYVYSFDDSMKVNYYRKNPKIPTNADIMHWFATVKPTPKRYNVPGRGFSYNNTNYMVLAAIVEKVTKQPFEEYLRRSIFLPLGMHDTYVATTKNDSINQYRTAGYQWNRRIPKDYFDDVVGDKGVYSTIDDLFRWYRALNGDCLLSRKTLAEAFVPRSFEKKGAKNYGYGFRMQLNALNQPEFIYHTGWWKGYNTMFWFSPKDEYVIIILGNRFNRTVYGIKELINVLHDNDKPITEDVSGEVEI